MAFINNPGFQTLSRLIKAANPTIQVTPDANNSYLAKATYVDEQASGLFAGKYGSGLAGYVDLTWRRLDIAKLFPSDWAKVYITEKKPLHDLLDDIYRSTGYRFGVEDIQNQSLVGADFPYIATIKAVEGNPIYFGEAVVTFVNRKYRLDEVVQQSELTPQLSYVQSVGGRQRAEYVTYGLDYTPVGATLLANYPTGKILDWTVDGSQAQLDTLALASLLRSVDTLPWKAVNETNVWTLSGGKVAYNGPTKDFNNALLDPRTPNDAYDNVMVIDFVTDRNGPSGWYGSALFVHYNTLEVSDGDH